MSTEKKRKLFPCKHNCYLKQSTLETHTFIASDLKLLKDLCKNFAVTPCFASTVFQYLNINITCSMIYSKFNTNINTYFNIKPKIPEKTYLSSKIKTEDMKTMYTPCNHAGTCYKNKRCTCYINNVSCEGSCLCTKCDLTLRCDCTVCDHKCPCYKINRECNCHASCHNKLTHNKKVKIQASTIAGLGLFADENIKKNTFVMQYIGEVISYNESERRGFFYDHKKLSYLFDLHCSDMVYHTIDATRIGNGAKFINHSGKPNMMARQMKVGGVFKMGFYAVRDIKKGDELYFDYKYTKALKIKYNIHD